MAGRTVVITGATGFIGRQAVCALIKRGYMVHALGTRPADQVPALPQGAQYHACDLFDQAALASTLKQIRPGHLLHFAWNATPGAYWTSPDNFRWVQASLSLLQCARAAGTERVVMAGSCAEYDWGRADICRESVTPTVLLPGGGPAQPYAVCKASLQQLASAFADISGLSVAWGRIFFLYGPNEHPNRLVPYVIRSLLSGQKALCSHGRQVRDFLHVADVGDAFAALTDCSVRGVVNIGSGEQIRLADLIGQIADCCAAAGGGGRELVFLGAKPAPQNEPALLVPDTTRLKKEVHWLPDISLSQGIRQTVEWWQATLNDEG